jgi:hypothetical protein
MVFIKFYVKELFSTINWLLIHGNRSYVRLEMYFFLQKNMLNNHL